MSQEIILYDTMRRAKVPFVPIDPALVKIYSCGPTVYSEPHLGNLRYFTLADLLRSTLEYIGGYKVTHVMNITDVGHLSGDNDWDADHGEDRMEKWARKEGMTVWQVARRYENRFLEYMEEFNITPFDVNPRATEHIPEQIAMVKKLREFGYTYVIENDGIYMNTSKISDYGKLARLDIAWLESQYRGEGAQIDSDKKKQITDFALWKFSPKDEKRGMEWVFDGDRSNSLLVDSEEQLPRKQDINTKEQQFVLRSSLTDEEEATRWFPGRHIECSAMSVKYLWEQFDIHTGWVDHIPVHHTNEIAQSECCLGKKPRVNYWLHQQFLQVGGGKMGKSKGHDLSVPGILAKWFSSLDMRYFYLTAHYRSFLDFSREALESARMTRANMMKKIAQQKLPTWEELKTHIPWKAYQEMSEAMADDLDTVKTITLVQKYLNELPSSLYDILLFDQQITKIGLLEWAQALQAQALQQAPESIAQLAQQRHQAKKDRNFSLADQLREQIREAGREVKDTSDSYELVKI